LPNIENEELKNWLRRKIEGKGGRINLSTLAIELSEKKNCVSKVHAKDASRKYKDYDGHEVKFESVTNGIAVDRWGDKKLLNIFRENDVIDKFDLPTESHDAKLDIISEAEIVAEKHILKEKLKKFLLQRKDQYGKPAAITEGAKIFNWRRRLADYKRPGMLFDNPEELADILESQNADLVMAGNVFPTDGPMKMELKRILDIIDKNKILKKRVHFIQDYDEDLGRALSQGADVSINTPTVKDWNGNRISTEACGTSWMKDVLNLNILVSTDDGGVADSTLRAEEEGRSDFSPSYLQIKGNNYREEVNSLYENLRRASQICDGRAEVSWGTFVKRQLAECLPIISGARMEMDYINLGFPPEKILFAA
jgi:glucan phosphorylase